MRSSIKSSESYGLQLPLPPPIPRVLLPLTTPDLASLRGQYRASFVGPAWLRVTAAPGLVPLGFGGRWARDRVPSPPRQARSVIHPGSERSRADICPRQQRYSAQLHAGKRDERLGRRTHFGRMSHRHGRGARRDRLEPRGLRSPRPVRDERFGGACQRGRQPQSHHHRAGRTRRESVPGDKVG